MTVGRTGNNRNNGCNQKMKRKQLRKTQRDVEMGKEGRASLTRWKEREEDIDLSIMKTSRSAWD